MKHSTQQNECYIFNPQNVDMREGVIEYFQPLKEKQIEHRN